MINKNSVKNILITRTDRLGDVILTLPLLNTAKQIFGNSKIFFLTKRYLEELITGYKDADELVIEENLKSFSAKYKFFNTKNIDLVINVKPQFDLALLFFLLRIKYRIGTGYRWYSFLYNYRVYEHRKISDKHESDYNINLLKCFFKGAAADKKFFFNYSLEEKNRLDKILKEYNLSTDDDYIIIHPGSGNSSRDLPAGKFSEYLNLFLDEYKSYSIVFTGLNHERQLVSEIAAGINPVHTKGTIDLTGKLDLRELMMLIDNCKLFISNSTGPIHIAGALDKSIIGFYPNEKPMSNVRWGPLSRNVIILNPGSDDDMGKIETKDIISATNKFLK